MKQKRHSTEEIIRILRQAYGNDTDDSICREHNMLVRQSVLLQRLVKTPDRSGG